MDAPTLQALTTVAGAALLTAVLMQYVILKALPLSPDSQDRWGPILAIVTGIVIVLLATFTVVTGVGKQDIGQGIVNGIFAGLSAIGLHSVGQNTLGSYVPALAKKPD